MRIENGRLRIRERTTWATEVLRGPAATLNYFAMLVAIALQDCFVLVFMEVLHTYRAICSKMEYRTDVFVCETKYQAGVLHNFGEC